MQSISDQRVLMQCLHVREELSTQFTLIDVTSQRQKKATPPTEERKYTIVQDARSHLVDQKFWRGVWRPTTGKGYLIVFSARSHLVLLDTWISICSPIAEKRCKFAQNARSYLVVLALWKGTCSSTVEKSPHLLRMQEVIWSSRTFEGTHDHPQQGKSIHLCPMPNVIWSSYIFEKTHAHSQWSEGTLLLRMWEVI